MGEIGRDRREFLYDMSYCDIVLIVRGYRRRNILLYQLQRLTAYGVFHSMSGDADHKGPDGWLPLYLDKYKTEDIPPISKEDYDDLMQDIVAMNSQETAP